MAEKRWEASADAGGGLKEGGDGKGEGISFFGFEMEDVGNEALLTAFVVLFLEEGT